GFIETPNQRLGIQFAISAGVTPETLARIPVARRDGAPLLLGDVAELVWGPQGLVGDAIINGGPGLMLIVEEFPWGNTLAVPGSEPTTRSSMSKTSCAGCVDTAGRGAPAPPPQ